MNKIIQGYPTPQKDQYKVYVRTITYNQAAYIEECLNGAVMQETDFPFVHHVIDDASTDGEQDVIKTWMERECDMANAEYYDNDLCTITLVKAKNNPNYTIAAYFLKTNLFKDRSAKENLYAPWREVCPYEAICEGDDYWTDPKKLQKQVDYLDTHEECALVHTAFDYYYQNENRFIPNDSQKLLKIESPTIEDIITRYHIQTHTVLFRSDMFRKAVADDPFLFSGYFKFGDTITWVQLRKFGTIHYIPDNTGVYRKNEGSATRSNIKAEYAMAVSSAEFKVHLCKRESFSRETESYLKDFLQTSLRRYYFFDPNFQPREIEGYVPSFIDKILLMTGLGRLYYTYIVLSRKKLGPIYRKIKKAY